eukprot:5601251-Ditylum_brightwellii.AAC.1
MNTCKSCAIGKAKQKNVPKQSEYTKADKSGQHVFIDVSMIKGVKSGPRVNAKQHCCVPAPLPGPHIPAP